MQPISHEIVGEFTRQAVHNVFGNMLALELVDDPPTPLATDPAGQIVAGVGFAGQATGIVYLYAGVSLAVVITGAMLGLTPAEVDVAMVNDAFGEVNNMVAGAVKSQICDRGWQCQLTIPSIVRGNGLRVESISKAKKTVFGFRSGPYRLLAELILKET
jgi:chemotaxis protein CheX